MKTTSIAMKTILLSLMFFSVVTAISKGQQDKPKGKPWSAPDNAVKMKSPVKGADAISEGKDLFNQHCKSCHGAKGKGDGTKADKIDISCNDFSTPEFAKKSEGELFWKVTEGRKPMPSFKDKLSDNERWEVIAFVKTLAK